ncbi:macrophage mannose receptor 1-like isoform X1 [Maniola jurtina]|uniref:macrophage mannose receptor 1-like isoform X1 n=1 Tax=Maniola jurtina TaxID=191418 RepID=UPI001E68C66B|nr:macrophage mannose receptor 1-like isoform X1 [Maniola jurtina]
MISCNRLFVLILVQYVAHLTYSQPSVKFFRKDYEYLEATQAFYKIHTLHKSWDDAKLKCEMEGALMFYPEDEDEAAAVTEYWNNTQPFSWIFIGVSTPNVKEVFETVDGIPIAEVYSKWGPGEPNDAGGVEGCVVMRRDGTLNDDNCEKKFPFICKKTLSTLEWNNYCNIPDTAYEFNEKKGRCYKFHLNPTNWTEAYKVCDSEQSYLAIINDDEEATFLSNLTNRAPKDKVEGDYLRGAVHLGFKNNNQVWKTIKGVTLRNSGYSKWGGGQPDGGENEKCGSMFYNGQLNDISCGTNLFFICEHEIDILSTGYVLRFGEVFKPIKP